MEEYVKKAINGDKDAFTYIFLYMQNKLYRIAYSRLKNEADALDAIQETIIHTYNNLHQLENIEAFESWIITILCNECNKIFNQKNKIHFLDITEIEDNEVIIENNIDDSLIFHDLIKSLNVKEKNILTLYYQNNYTSEDISKSLNIKDNTVKSIIKRAKAKLEKFLKE